MIISPFQTVSRYEEERHMNLNEMKTNRWTLVHGVYKQKIMGANIVPVFFLNFSNKISATLNIVKSLPFNEALPYLARLCECLSHGFIYLHYLGLVFPFLNVMVYIFLCLLLSTIYLTSCFIDANKGVDVSPDSCKIRN